MRNVAMYAGQFLQHDTAKHNCDYDVDETIAMHAASQTDMD